MRKNYNTRKYVLAALAIVLCAIPLQVSAQFPSVDTLKKSNVSLNLEGFTFTSGLTPTATGVFNGQGAEMVAVRWAGSGFIIDESGTIVTNYHVARKSLRGKAIFADGSSYDITHMKAYDPVFDLAVMKINANKKFKEATLGDSDTIKEMNKVIAVGNSLDMGFSVTDGTVSQLIRDAASGALVSIRHSAPIAPGNSGGALYKGKDVVGVNVSMVPGYQMYYAIPVNIVKPLIAKFPNLVPLEAVFPPNLDGILKKVQQITTANGRVEAAKDKTTPGLYQIQFDMYGLEDYLISLQSPGRDLSLAVFDRSMQKVLGYSDYKGENEVLIYPSEWPATVVVVVFNYDNVPADFGLGFFNIIW
jgi:S1-C subfamily serine protease